MSLQPRRPSDVEREVERVFGQSESKKQLSEYELGQNALRENLRRLRAERLSRESLARDAAGERG
jgi:hypothetical protein